MSYGNNSSSDNDTNEDAELNNVSDNPEIHLAEDYA